MGNFINQFSKDSCLNYQGSLSNTFLKSSFRWSRGRYPRGSSSSSISEVISFLALLIISGRFTGCFPRLACRKNCYLFWTIISSLKSLVCSGRYPKLTRANPAKFTTFLIRTYRRYFTFNLDQPTLFRDDFLHFENPILFGSSAD